MSIYNYISMICSVLIAILILVQTRGASLGAGSSSASEVNTKRRGVEKTIFQLTIILAVIFCVSLILSVIVKK